jgi:murein DD-endopeptidase MepM/ murein hydrolase activator NlpD
LRAKVGDVVMKGAIIAEVGSSGRATGPHLHFEVRHRGVAQNPARFLRLAG